MKFTASSDIDRLKGEDEVKRFTAIAFDQVEKLFNNGLTIADNFNAKVVTMTFSTANATVTAIHGLGRVPAGFILVGSTEAMSIYNGSSENTSSLLYLRASAVGVARVLVF